LFVGKLFITCFLLRGALSNFQLKNEKYFFGGLHADPPQKILLSVSLHGHFAVCEGDVRNIEEQVSQLQQSV
tara:strand:- start:471 stop:686 length:216 start_codon:yes stop_codon:yes gene_type:complete